MSDIREDSLYDDWDDFWDREDNVTLLGKIMTKVRMQAYRDALAKLEIKTALDVGCGTGLVLEIFSKLGYECEGIDVSKNSVTICQKKGMNARVALLEEMEGSYDLVESEGMLEHFLHFEPYATHMMRLSKRYVMIMQPNHGSFWGRTLVYAAQLLRSNVLMFEYNYRMSDFIDVFDKHGFRNIISEPVFFNTSRLLVFEKK